jgi:hypothetical protein
MDLLQHKLRHESNVSGFYLRKTRLESAPEHRPSPPVLGRFPSARS